MLTEIINVNMKKIILLFAFFSVISIFNTSFGQSTLFLNGVTGSTSTPVMDVSLINSGTIKVEFLDYLNGGNWNIRVDWVLPGGSIYSEVYSTSNNIPITFSTYTNEFRIYTTWFTGTIPPGSGVPVMGNQTLFYLIQ